MVRFSNLAMSKLASNFGIQNISKTITRAECRICLKKDGTLPIFGDEAKPDISMEISMFGEVQLEENDDLPKFICELCFKLLEGAISFRKLAKRSDSLLRRRNKKKNTSSHRPPAPTFFKTEKIEFGIAPPAPTQYSYVMGDKMFENTEYCIKPSDSKNDFVYLTMENAASNEFSNLEYEQGEDTVQVGNSEEFDANILNEDVALNTTVTTQPTHNCKYCRISFQSLESYEEHRATVEHKRNYVMSFLPKKKSISAQKKKTVNPKDYMCEICNRVYTKVHFARHMYEVHNIEVQTSNTPKRMKKQCTMCTKMFHPAALKNHMKRIHGNNDDMKPKVKLECPMCKKYFSKQFYPLHMQRHKQGETKNYICEQCGKKFSFKSSYCTHRLVHTNSLPHKCDYCPYRGRTKELLKIHVRTHTGDHPYQCPQCDTRCSTKSNLNSHMRRHRGPIDFICDVCNRGFYSKIQLERHISVIHYGVKNYMCSTCGAAFGYRHGLMSHERKVHKRPKGLGKPRAVYLQLEEEGLLPPEPQKEV